MNLAMYLADLVAELVVLDGWSYVVPPVRSELVVVWRLGVPV